MILLEGPIGAGKTALGEILEKELGLPLFRELRDPVTETLLNRYYRDQHRWAFTMQTHFVAHRLRMIQELVQHGGGIMDRSIFGDRIFARMLAHERYMDEEEFSTYTNLLDGVLRETPAPTLLVYLDCSVDTAMDRIRRRNRGRESEIPRSYLEDLHRRYRTWYEQYTDSPKILLDTHGYHPDHPEQVQAVVERIRSFIGDPQEPRSQHPADPRTTHR